MQIIIEMVDGSTKVINNKLKKLEDALDLIPETGVKKSIIKTDKWESIKEYPVKKIITTRKMSKQERLDMIKLHKRGLL